MGASASVTRSCCRSPSACVCPEAARASPQGPLLSHPEPWDPLFTSPAPSPLRALTERTRGLCFLLLDAFSPLLRTPHWEFKRQMCPIEISYHSRGRPRSSAVTHSSEPAPLPVPSAGTWRHAQSLWSLFLGVQSTASLCSQREMQTSYVNSPGPYAIQPVSSCLTSSPFVHLFPHQAWPRCSPFCSSDSSKFTPTLGLSLHFGWLLHLVHSAH